MSGNKNRRKVYGQDFDAERADGIPCAVCGCRHSYIVRTVRIGCVVRRTRMCRNCGRQFYTSESA